MSDAYAEFDAERRFGVADYRAEESSECISGLILQGLKKPHESAAFGTRCTPEHPLGATIDARRVLDMLSGEQLPRVC